MVVGAVTCTPRGKKYPSLILHCIPLEDATADDIHIQMFQRWSLFSIYNRISLVEVDFDEDALVGILPVYLELPEKTLCKETNRVPPTMSARTLRARENLLKPEKLIVNPKIDGSRPIKKVAKKGGAGKGCVVKGGAGKPSPKVSTPVVPPLSLKHTTESLNKYTVAQLRETLIKDGIGGVGASRWSKQCCIDAILDTYVAPTLPVTLEMSQKSKKESKKEPKEKPKKKPKKEPKKKPKKGPKKGPKE